MINRALASARCPGTIAPGGCIVAGVLTACAWLLPLSAQGQVIDLADPANREHWFSDPVMGEASYDSFDRAAHNPIYVGKPPFEWPVNGSLFRDPRTENWYCHISLYPKGYWPAGPSLLLRSSDQGKTWKDLGFALQGDANLFDGDGQKAGATLDVTEVADDAGYHLTYGWVKPDNSDGGIAYAFSKSADGPFLRDFPPMHTESRQPLLPPGYKRVYCSTIVKRSHDWLIVSSMSTPRNAGGMWAMVALTAPRPEGPWSPPTFIRAPHLPDWYPQPIEYCPGFVHEGHVYGALTSVALNRSWQMWLRAPVEDAHKPEAWSVFQAGSLFHAETNEWERMGIWGQSFHGFVNHDGIYQMMYPARTAAGIGTISLASRPWNQPFRRGFWVSAPNAPSLALLRNQYRDFHLELTLAASGPYRVIWNNRAPLGPDRSHAQSRVSPLSLTRQTALVVGPKDWRVERIDAQGRSTMLAEGSRESASSSATSSRPDAGREEKLDLAVVDGELRIDFDGKRGVAMPAKEVLGGIGLLAETGTCLHVSAASIEGDPIPEVWSLLPLDGMMNAGQLETNWKHGTHHFRFGTGYTSDREDALVKWNYTGTKVRLWSPRLPGGGKAKVLLDGKERGVIDLDAPTAQESTLIWEAAPPAGRHTVMLRRISGSLIVDSLDFTP